MFFLLAIAIDGYTGFNPLRNAVNGARSLADVLQRKFGFAPERVRMLLEAAATRDNILKVLREVILALGEHDSLLIYYAGHGHLDKELQIGYWIPVHAEQGNLGGWITHKEIKEMLGASRARHILLLVDSCFSGDLLRETEGPVVEISEPHVRYAFGRKSRHVLTSGASEPVMDGGLPGHSIFTGFLIRELEESRHPWVLIQDLHCRVRGAVAVNSGQKPQFGHLFGAGGERDGEFVLLNRAYQREAAVGVATSPLLAPVAPEAVYLKCPRCGARSLEQDTFECRVCRTDYLCDEERDPNERCCRNCAPKQAEKRAAAERAEAERLAAKRLANEKAATERAEAGRRSENSLGMRFVPVPGTKVWFSIWDTRVQDYAAFATTTGSKWLKPGYEQGPTHPAVNVSWEDAHAFCAWLTERERLACRLRVDELYRLPTDAEWSVAVGLTEESGATPAKKDGRILNHYPWGTKFPPPVGAGNYASSLPVDTFDHTSPVGSFATNYLGLFDMGGNVWEWCEDKYYGTGLLGLLDNRRVLRGASWGDGREDYIRSSTRLSVGPRSRHHDVGFRVVVAGAAEP